MLQKYPLKNISSTIRRSSSRLHYNKGGIIHMEDMYTDTDPYITDLYLWYEPK